MLHTSYQPGDRVALTDLIRVLLPSGTTTLPEGTTGRVVDIDGAALSVKFDAGQTTVLVDEVRPAPELIEREGTLAAIRATSAMTDALAAALQQQIQRALRHAGPERILDEIAAAWGDGAHHAAEEHLVTLGYEYSEQAQGWRYMPRPSRSAA